MQPAPRTISIFIHFDFELLVVIYLFIKAALKQSVSYKALYTQRLLDLTNHFPITTLAIEAPYSASYLP